MKRTPVVLIHGVYWLIYLALLMIVFAIVQIQVSKTPLDLQSLFPLIVLCVAPNLASFYAFYLLLFPKFLARRKIILLVVFGAAVCLASAIAGAFLSLFFFGFKQAIFADPREFAALAASFFIIAALHGAIALTIRGFITWYAELKLTEELARKNFEMELALIKSQINPHFLFNTINNIDVLIAKNPALASAYLNKLSEILRYMIYETKPEKIPLARELNYIEKYLDLQKIRTTNPDYINFERKGETADFTIAPMILFPFIENAFKHTEHKKNANSIRIQVSIEKRRLVFVCENSYHVIPEKKQDFGGVGNELVKKRLELLYPERHLLEIKDDGTNYKVKLTLL